MSEQGDVTVPEDTDFDALYRGEQLAEGVELEQVPWDIEGPQPVLVELEAAGGLRGPILDVGCGPGDNARFLASRGYQVTGVDGSPTALDGARVEAAADGLEISYIETDATTLDGVEPGFQTILDSALYHCLGDEERHRYAAAIHRVAEPSAVLQLFCFGGADPATTLFPVTQEDLREHLAPYWDIASIEETQYTTSMTREKAQALLTSERVNETGATAVPERMPVDEQGRLRVSVWHLRATRK